MSAPINLAGYRRILTSSRRQWRRRFPSGSAVDIEALARWSARYGIAGVTGHPLPHAGPTEADALARLEADQ